MGPASEVPVRVTGGAVLKMAAANCVVGDVLVPAGIHDGRRAVGPTGGFEERILSSGQL